MEVRCRIDVVAIIAIVFLVGAAWLLQKQAPGLYRARKRHMCFDAIVDCHSGRRASHRVHTRF